MFVEDMPGCCCAEVVSGFGGGEEFDSLRDQKAKSTIRRELHRALSCSKRRGVALVFATTTSNQPNAKEVLEEFGFYTAAPVSIPNSERGRKIQAWFLPLSEYNKRG